MQTQLLLAKSLLPHETLDKVRVDTTDGSQAQTLALV